MQKKKKKKKETYYKKIIKKKKKKQYAPYYKVLINVKLYFSYLRKKGKRLIERDIMVTKVLNSERMLIIYSLIYLSTLYYYWMLMKSYPNLQNDLGHSNNGS